MTADNTPQPSASQAADSGEPLNQKLLHDLRMLSEKQFGNETYDKYLSYNHELQRIIAAAVQADRKAVLERLKDKFDNKYSSNLETFVIPKSAVEHELDLLEGKQEKGGDDETI